MMQNTTKTMMVNVIDMYLMTKGRELLSPEETSAHAEKIYLVTKRVRSLRYPATLLLEIFLAAITALLLGLPFEGVFMGLATIKFFTGVPIINVSIDVLATDIAIKVTDRMLGKILLLSKPGKTNPTPFPQSDFLSVNGAGPSA